MNVHHCWEAGIFASGDYSIVEDSRVWQNAQRNNTVTHPASGWATGLSAARDAVNGITDHAILRRNTVFNNWGEGLSTFEAEGTILEDNVVYDNWAVNIYISDAANVLCQRNLVYTTSNNVVGGKAGGIWLADELAGKPRSTNNVVINNFVYGGTFDAFSWTEVAGSGLDHVLIANNTLVNAVFNIGSNPNSPTPATNTSAMIVNNIFFADSGNPWDLNTNFANLTFSNNLWSATPPADISGGATDVIGNPRLARTGSVSPGLLSPDYFRLLTNSPAIKKGAVLAAVTTDFFGTVRGTPPCIGGDEMSSRSSTDQ
jgi:parallel beta-helix repeat protein